MTPQILNIVTLVGWHSFYTSYHVENTLSQKGGGAQGQLSYRKDWRDLGLSTVSWPELCERCWNWLLDLSLHCANTPEAVPPCISLRSLIWLKKNVSEHGDDTCRGLSTVNIVENYHLWKEWKMILEFHGGWRQLYKKKRFIMTLFPSKARTACRTRISTRVTPERIMLAMTQVSHQKCF